MAAMEQRILIFIVLASGIFTFFFLANRNFKIKVTLTENEPAIQTEDTLESEPLGVKDDEASFVVMPGDNDTEKGKTSFPLVLEAKAQGTTESHHEAGLPTSPAASLFFIPEVPEETPNDALSSDTLERANTVDVTEKTKMEEKMTSIATIPREPETTTSNDVTSMDILKKANVQDMAKETQAEKEMSSFATNDKTEKDLDIPREVRTIEITKETDSSQDKPPAGCEQCCPQSLRVAAIKQYCQENPHLQTYLKDPRNSRSPLRNILVSETHKILLCINAKSGSRLWGDTLVRSSSYLSKKLNLGAKSVFDLEDPKLQKELNIFSLKEYSGDRLFSVLRDYVKVMVVRNPIERILSAYRDKFVHSPLGQGSLDGYNYVLKKYRKVPPSDLTTDLSRSMLGMPKITLTEFVQMVTDKASPFNLHWDSFVNNCHPCVINYDHILRTETGTWDAVPVLDILSRGVPKGALKHDLASRDKEALKKSFEEPTFNKIIPEFASVPKEQMIKLVQHFKTDLEMFSYHYDTASLVESCALVNHTTMEVCC